MSTLEENFQFYLDNQAELVKLYSGRVIVVNDKQVVGDFDGNSEAYEFGVAEYGEGNFLMQLCTPGENDYTLTYTSQILVG